MPAKLPRYGLARPLNYNLLALALIDVPATQERWRQMAKSLTAVLIAACRLNSKLAQVKSSRVSPLCLTKPEFADSSAFVSLSDFAKLTCVIVAAVDFQGWDEGIIAMSLGEKAVLHISPDYGYGSQVRGHSAMETSMYCGCCNKVFC